MTKIYRLLDFEFSPAGGPIDDPVQARKLFQKLGNAAAAWARMELMLDVILLHINKASIDPGLYDNRHPIAFKRKIKLMRRWLAHSAFVEHEAVFHKSLAIMQELSNVRNDFLHSSIKDYDPQRRLFSFLCLRSLGNDRFELREDVASIEALDQLVCWAKTATLALTEIADLVIPHKTGAT